MNTNSKKLIASFAALQILLYHCWIPVFGAGTPLGMAERFLIASTYSGVDTYFFLSAYSLVSRPVEDYGGFIKNRLIKLMPLFFIALAAGRFLWFIPSIMVLYLILPPLEKLCRKKPASFFFLLMAAWIGTVVLVLGWIAPDSDLGIFLFRIPSMILGAYAVKYRERLTVKQTLPAGILFLISGILLTYRFGYLRKLNTPFRGSFYLTGIPMMLGTILLLDRLAERVFPHRLPKIVEQLGSMTLELYFSQVVFGTLLVQLFFRVTDSRIVVNGMVLAGILLISILVKMGNDIIRDHCLRSEKKRISL